VSNSQKADAGDLGDESAGDEANIYGQLFCPQEPHSVKQACACTAVQTFAGMLFGAIRRMKLYD
jgi:hypothetical protein